MPVDWARALPADAKTADYERGNIAALGGLPCIRFVPDLEKDAVKKPQTFQLRIGGGKANYTKFAGGTCEDAVLHILRFRQITSKLNRHKDLKKYRKEQQKAEQELEAGISAPAVAAATNAGGNDNA